MNVTCPHCGTPQLWGRTIIAERRKAGLPDMQCATCGQGFTMIDTKVGKNDNQKRSNLQEKKEAARHGGQRTAASGAGQVKGDFRKFGVVRGECKFTRAASYTLKLEDLKKIEQAAQGKENPVMAIEFQGVYPPQTYYVLPAWLYEHYARTAGDLE
jgi:hypothetical protein